MRELVKQTETIFVGDIAANSDALLYAVWKVPAAVKITAVRMGVKASVPAADTNYNTFELKNDTVVVAAVANGPVAGGTSFVLGTFSDMVVNVAAAECDIAADSTLVLKVTKTGNGLAMTGVCIQIEYLPN